MSVQRTRAIWASCTAAALVAGSLLGMDLLAAPAGAQSGPQVLLVGTYRGIAGKYSTIQSAVKAANPGDWILVAPGDYHEVADEQSKPSNTSEGQFGGVLIRKPGIHLRGMNRNTVIVDGTKKSASGSCSNQQSDQNFGAMGSNGKALGRNGIVVFKSNGVSVQNLTVCNFLGGAGDAGNAIWWNGGDGSGKIGLLGYRGSYLTATSTYYQNEATAATYGIFSSNASGGSWNQLYASNFNDSGMYVGACQQRCNVVIQHAWMEYNPLGYSGTNSGGVVVIEHSQFDNNQDGLDTDTQIDGDPPAPQQGLCPNGGKSPITHTRSCWVFMHNYVHDNNNPNVPKAGAASAGPTGTGMTVSGGRNDTVMDNVFSNNGAWGALFVPYPDQNKTVMNQSCTGTGGFTAKGFSCIYDPVGNALLNNTFQHNGYFGNPSNSDFGQITLRGGESSNCYAGNTAPDGSAPANLEATQPTCGKRTNSANTGGPLLGQVACDTGFGPCDASSNYPKATGVDMHALPPDLPTMSNPCAGVPSNAWCRTS